MHPIALTWTPLTPVPSVSAAGASPWPSAALSGTVRSSSLQGTGAGGSALEGTAPLSPSRPVPARPGRHHRPGGRGRDGRGGLRRTCLLAGAAARAGAAGGPLAVGNHVLGSVVSVGGGCPCGESHASRARVAGWGGIRWATDLWATAALAFQLDTAFAELRQRGTRVRKQGHELCECCDGIRGQSSKSRGAAPQ